MLKFSAKLQQNHNLCNKKTQTIKFRGGYLVDYQLVVIANYKTALIDTSQSVDNFCKKSTNCVDFTPTFFITWVLITCTPPFVIHMNLASSSAERYG